MRVLEKPNLAGCKKAVGDGALWNTMGMAAKVETLWNLGLRCFPELMGLLEVYSGAIGTAREHLVLERIYQVMPRRKFSAHLLQECPEQVAVMELRGVLWSDWGKPERIAETLQDRQGACFLSGAHCVKGRLPHRTAVSEHR